jgi:riboflavin biosynthesis pyrimidine reductase
MVEGGARVIQSFFARPELVQRIIVTVVPVFVGQGGVSYNIQTQVIHLLNKTYNGLTRHLL